MASRSLSFGDFPPRFARYGDSRAVVWPLPFERTTSYGRGTVRGPEAILRASHFVEWYDEELGWEPHEGGVATLPPFVPASPELAAALDEIEGQARRHMQRGKFLVALGGEHSLSAPLVRAARGAFGELGVVQFDAHADLRSEYEGTAASHACVMRRILEEEIPSLAVGLRSLSREEADLIRDRGLAVLWASELASPQEALERFARALEKLPEKVYLTFDLDFFDPALVPATGTPEPGGGTWYPTLALLRTLFQRKRVVAMDVVELLPIPDQPTSDFVAARLVLKCLGYLRDREGRD